MSLKRLLAFLFFLPIIISPDFFERVLAQTNKTIIINELAWAGSSVSTTDEWLELYNDTNNEINLQNWSMTYFDGANEKPMVTLLGIIKAKDYFLVSNNSQDHQFSKGESLLNVGPNLIDSAVSLSNNHLQIKLYDNLGNLVDTAGDKGKPLAGSNNPYRSMQRTKEGLWADAGGCVNLDKCENDLATPKSQNIFASSEQTMLYPAIMIAEIYPYPNKGEEEYIIIKNLSSNHYDLTNFYLVDRADKKYTFQNIQLEPKEELPLYQKETGIYLNNSGEEELYLKNPDGIILSSLKYGGAIKYTKYLYKDNQYQWDRVLTTTTTSAPTATTTTTTALQSSNIQSGTETKNIFGNVKNVKGELNNNIPSKIEYQPPAIKGIAVFEKKWYPAYNTYLIAILFFWSIVCALSQKKLKTL